MVMWTLGPTREWSPLYLNREIHQTERFFFHIAPLLLSAWDDCCPMARTYPLILGTILRGTHHEDWGETIFSSGRRKRLCFSRQMKKKQIASSFGASKRRLEEGRLRPFRYRYRIPVSVAVTVSGTVNVLNGTRYLRYPIPTSRCRYR